MISKVVVFAMVPPKQCAPLAFVAMACLVQSASASERRPDRTAWSDVGILVELTAWGRQSALAPTPSFEWRESARACRFVPACTRRDVATAEGISAWVESEPGRLEHGWELGERPPGAGPLVLELEVEGAVVGRHWTGRRLWLVDPHGERARYDGLHAWDATGRDLPAHFERDGWDQMSIVIDDTDATWPVTVDPEISWVPIQIEGPSPNFGMGVRWIPDLDGDGDDELLVAGDYPYSRQLADSGIMIYEGGDSRPGLPRAYVDDVWNGGLASLTGAIGDVTGDGHPDFTASLHGENEVHIYSKAPNGAFGLSFVASIPLDFSDALYTFSDTEDVNGDGVDDIAIGEVHNTNHPGGVEIRSGVNPAGSSLMRIDSTGYIDRVGHDVVSCDVDGDGDRDLLVGRPGAFAGGKRGAVDVYAWTGTRYELAGTTESATANDDRHVNELGTALACIPDVDGDGASDFIAGGPRGETSLLVFTGIEPVLFDVWLSPDETPIGSIFAGTDLENDGIVDLAVTTYAHPNYLITGSIGDGPKSVVVSALGLASSTHELYVNRLAVGGDWDGDGIGDIAVGISHEATRQVGVVAIHLGCPEDVDGDGLSGDADCDDHNRSVVGPQLWGQDADRDGFTARNSTVTACEAPGPEWLSPTSPSDCDDTDPAINPDADDNKADGVDMDCDGDNPTCGCSTTSGGSGALVILAALALSRRRGA